MIASVNCGDPGRRLGSNPADPPSPPAAADAPPDAPEAPVEVISPPAATSAFSSLNLRYFPKRKILLNDKIRAANTIPIGSTINAHCSI